MKIYIYVLKHPVTKEVRYVGQTVNVNKRYQEHLCVNEKDAALHKGRWINKLLKVDLKPTIEVVEIVSNLNWKDRERYWISYYKSSKNNLTNLTDGGEGVLGLKFSSRVKRKLSQTHHGIRLSAYHRQRISEGHIGHLVSEQTREKLRLAHTGKRLTKETRHRIGIAGLGRISTQRKQVLQLDFQGTLIRTWDSISSAAKELNLSIYNISSCCHNKRNFCGSFKWKLA